MTPRTPLVSPLSGLVLQPDCWAAGVLCNLPDWLSYLYAVAVSCLNGTHFRLKEKHVWIIRDIPGDAAFASAN